MRNKGNKWGQFMKRALLATSLSSLMMLASSLPVSATAATVGATYFKDVTSRHWAVKNGTIQWGLSARLISGYPDHTLKPDKAVTEAEFLRMFISAYQPVQQPASGHWADGYYSAAASLHYPLRGLSSASAKDSNINREQAAELVTAADGANYTGSLAIRYVLGRGLANGKTPGSVSVESYGGTDSLTRAEAVQFIKNAKSKGLTVLKTRPTNASDPASLPPLPTEKQSGMKIQIRDESAQDPTLVQFLDQLKKTVSDKDKAALLAAIDPTIRVSFGSDQGIEAFRKMWVLDTHPETSPVWKELNDALSLGGNFSKMAPGTYFIPYLYENFPNNVDAFQYGGITGSNVNVRSAPSLGAPVIAQLTYDVVKAEAPLTASVRIGDYTYPWVAIVTPDGKKGYVAQKYIRKPVDYRMGLRKDSTNHWKINLFVTGD
jgi:hypothetical protein